MTPLLRNLPRSISGSSVLNVARKNKMVRHSHSTAAPRLVTDKDQVGDKTTVLLFISQQVS